MNDRCAKADCLKRRGQRTTNRKCANRELSQRRGSPHKHAPLFVPIQLSIGVTSRNVVRRAAHRTVLLPIKVTTLRMWAQRATICRSLRPVLRKNLRRTESARVWAQMATASGGGVFILCVNLWRYFHLMGSTSFTLWGRGQAKSLFLQHAILTLCVNPHDGCFWVERGFSPGSRVVIRFVIPSPPGRARDLFSRPITCTPSPLQAAKS